MKPTYLLYAKTGKEQQVADDLRLMAIDVWCGLVLEGKPDPKRAGRKRVTMWVERPYMPNYIFAEMAPYDFYRAKAHKFVAERIEIIPESSMADLRRFQARVDRDYDIALRAKGRGEEAPPAFADGEPLEIISGPLRGLLGSFRGLVEDVDGWHVQVDLPLTDKAKVSAADVRKAG